MDYESAYKAMVQRAKELHKGGNALTKQQMEIVCPELAENENNRIGNVIYCIVRDNKEVKRILESNGISVDNALVYLEKQKEPALIPDKFSGLKSLMLQYLQSAANRKDDTEIESDTDLWGRKILDYVWKYDGTQKEQNLNEYPLCETIKDKIKCYIANHFIADREVTTDIPSIVHAMEEGVRLGKEEQNTSPLVQIVENNKAIVEDIRNGVPTKAIEEARGVKFATPIVKEQDEKVYTFIIDFFENCWWNKNWEISREQVLKLLNDLTQQQKVKWSVEDEEKLNWCINLVISQDSLSSEWKKEVLDWLKSIRFQHQGSTHRDVLHSIYSLLKDYDFTQITPEHRVSLLNEIRVRCKHADEWAEILDEPCWKPSEEQMTDLFIAAGEGCEAGSPTSNTLKTLYKDLKKL